MGKFKVGDKVEIIENRNGSVNSIGNIGEITNIEKHFDGKWYKVAVEGNPNKSNYSHHGEIRLIERKSKVKERLEVAEEKIAKQSEEINELKVIVEALRKRKFNFEAEAEDAIYYSNTLNLTIINDTNAIYREVK